MYNQSFFLFFFDVIVQHCKEIEEFILFCQFLKVTWSMVVLEYLFYFTPGNTGKVRWCPHGFGNNMF